MATSNRERVGKALDLLKAGLGPYVDRELTAAVGRGWLARLPVRPSAVGGALQASDLDVQALLVVMRDQWPPVFSKKLDRAHLNLVHELVTVRNQWAHQEPFSTDDAYRALDSVSRLLAAVSAAAQLAEVEHEKQELLRLRFEEQVRRERQRAAAVAPVESRPASGLRPWRELMTPHADVASGRYQQAEFAADLGQVHRGEGADEYRLPGEFFRRTFLTEGLRHLLAGALRRLAGVGGDPVIELQTNFGGGKTHSMLALYHLFAGTPAGALPGVEELLQIAGVGQPPKAQRAVLVGAWLSPAQPRRYGDTVVRTLWGELAWQLGREEGYSLVAEADAHRVSPGAEALRDLFELYAPCLILIDEWVSFVRQLYGREDLPAGSFDANLSFAQALTEAARQAPQTLVVASLPASDIEIGGEAGRAALDRLRNTFARLESPWRPASAEEGFEIVRRRLFEPMADPQAFPARDAVVRAFSELYARHAGEFPGGCREGAYARRLTAAYPIHPELFDRLYTDWSSLDKFQRTRGVLRLMAAVIHTLWERQDGSLLILPASVPIDDPAVQSELTHYLEDPWTPVIEKDVDGPHSLPLRLDRESPTLGRYSACRRVARTLYLGSAPTLRTSHRGLDDRHIKLGCAQPGESVATFGDALRRLTDEATHLYVDGGRYWFAIQPSVTRLAQDRAAQLREDAVAAEIQRRVKAQQGQRGDFVRVYPGPASHGDVPDDPEAYLVILGPEHPHSARAADSPARAAAAALLDQRGASPRRYRNALVCLAPDKTRLGELEQAVRQYLAWQSIEAERELLNLDSFQANQARTKRQQADDTVDGRLPETYYWLLVPTQAVQGPVEWQELRLQGAEPLAVRASRKLKNDGLLLTQFGPTLLRLELDRVPLWRGEHVSTRQLWEDFAQYLYLPRLRDSDVLATAIRDGAATLTWATDTFAYAERWDEATGRYLGLRAGATGSVALDGASLVVKPAAAQRQLAAEAAAHAPTLPGDSSANYVVGPSGGVIAEPDGSVAPIPLTPAPAAPELGRFHGAVALDPLRINRDVGQITEAVIQHLTSLLGARVTITMELQAEFPSGVPEHVVRTVTENCRTLRFLSAGFEES